MISDRSSRVHHLRALYGPYLRSLNRNVLWTKQIMNAAIHLQSRITQPVVEDSPREWEIWSDGVSENGNESQKSTAAKKPSHTREVRDTPARTFEELPLRPNERYQAMGFDGKPYTMIVPKYDPETQQLGIKMKGYLDRALELDENGKLQDNDPKTHAAYHLEVWDLSTHMKQRTCRPLKGRNEPYFRWKRAWEVAEGSSWQKKIRSGVHGLVERYWPWLREVDEIICFALGALESEFGATWVNSSGMTVQQIKDMDTTFIQALTAREFRNCLEEQHRKEQEGEVDDVGPPGEPAVDKKQQSNFVQTLKTSPKSSKQQDTKMGKGKAKSKQPEIKRIRILSQDPGYCSNCIRVLKEHLEIEAYADFTGFARMTRKSFVICINPSVDIGHFVQDILRTSDGPAALLSEEIMDEERDWMGGELDFSYLKWDRSTPRDTSQKGEKAIANQPTKSMFEYEQACTGSYIGDFRAIAGKLKREVQWGDYPSTIDIKKKVDDIKDEGEKKIAIGDFEQKYGQSIQELRESAKRIAQARKESRLGDLYLYIRTQPLENLMSGSRSTQ